MTAAHEDDELEPFPGLPERLPEGKHALWQGKPRWQSLAVRAMHVKALALYFGGLATWRFAILACEGSTALEATIGAL